MFLGTWIADIAMVYADGDQIRTYLAAKDVQHRLRTARGRVKAVVAAQKNAGGGAGNEEVQIAIDDVIRLGFKLDNLKTGSTSERRTVGALITFNHEASYWKALKVCRNAGTL